MLLVLLWCFSIRTAEWVLYGDIFHDYADDLEILSSISKAAVCTQNDDHAMDRVDQFEGNLMPGADQFEGNLMPGAGKVISEI